jgi:hypothetical protein
VREVTGLADRLRLWCFHWTWGGTMRKIVLLIAATVLILGSVEVWAGGSRNTATDDAGVFVISNAL